MEKQQNVGRVERALRIFGGGLAAIIGLFVLFPSPGSAGAWALGITLVLLGVDFFYTGLTGYCPLYHRLGVSTSHSKA